MIAAVVVVVDQLMHGAAQFVRTGIDQQVHARFERLVEALDLAVGLGMMRRSVDVADRDHAQILFENTRQITRAVITEQLRAFSTGTCRMPVKGHRLFHHIADGIGGGVRLQIAGQHEAQVIVEHLD